MPDFTVSHLQAGQIAEAYALVRMAAPEVEPERWQAFADSQLGRHGGVLGVFAGDSTLHGVAAYRPDESLRHGRTLRVDTIVTFELNRSAPAREALCEALALLGRALDCASVTVAMPGRGYADPASAKAAPWSALGLALDAVLFVKKLPQAVRRTEAAAATA